MTLIIATKDAIYADTRVKDGGCIVGDSCKLQLVTVDGWGSGWLATTGHAGDSNLLLDRMKEKGMAAVGPEGSATAMLAADGTIWCCDADTAWFELDTKYTVLGSGWDYALALLDTGMTPLEAMKRTAIRYPGIGGKVHVALRGGKGIHAEYPL